MHVAATVLFQYSALHRLLSKKSKSIDLREYSVELTIHFFGDDIYLGVQIKIAFFFPVYTVSPLD